MNDIFSNLKDDQYDPAVFFLDVHLENLLKIITKIGEPLEGNILYEHMETDFGSGFSPNFLAKRRALSVFAMANNNILEVGFNSGFSSLLMLSMNEGLKITAIDLCEHKYTIPCYEYLKQAFPGRLNLYPGNSLYTIPRVLAQDNLFNAYHIDGGHGIDVAEADLLNVISSCKNGSIICFDDTDFYDLRCMLLKYVLSGKIISIASDFDLINTGVHMFFKVTK